MKFGPESVVDWGNIAVGNIEAGNIEAGNIEANSEASNIVAGITEAGNIEAGRSGNIEGGYANLIDMLQQPAVPMPASRWLQFINWAGDELELIVVGTKIQQRADIMLLYMRFIDEVGPMQQQ